MQLETTALFRTPGATPHLVLARVIQALKVGPREAREAIDKLSSVFGMNRSELVSQLKTAFAEAAKIVESL